MYQIKLIAANYHKRKTNCNENHSTTTILAKNASNREKNWDLSYKNKLNFRQQGKRVTR